MLAPERAVTAQALMDLGLLSLFDALATLAPPHVPVAILPDGIAVDGARAAWVKVWQAPGALTADNWAVLGFEVAIDPPADAPGDAPGLTCLNEEGFGDTSAIDVVVETCRYLLRWVDAWHEGGAPALAHAPALARLLAAPNQYAVAVPV